MSDEWTRRLVGITGILYVLIALLNTGDGSAKPSWGRADLELVGLLALLTFCAALARLLRRAEGASGALSTIALAAAILAVAIKLSSFPFAVAANLATNLAVDTHLASMLTYMNRVAFTLTEAASALFLLAVAAVAIRTGAIPRWLGGAAALVGVGFIATVALWTLQAPFDFSPVELVFLVWILVTSIVLLAGARSKAARDAASTAEPLPAATR